VYGPAMRDLADTGRVISGRYRLESPIGRGAMGVVWRARDQLLDRDVAVKEVQMADTLSADERANAYQRTLREAKTAARLSHPGVVSVYDVADDGGRPWIVMELVNARSLDQVLAADGPLSPRQTAEIGRQLLAALSVAHTAGVLHRDVKPSNVLLGQDGRAVLTDFGIATFQGDPKLTQTGMVMGSPGFTAPERIKGGDATPASDLWSLGATLYAAVQGYGPYEARGGAITTMSAIINEDAPAATAAGALDTVISALLRREPADRPDAATAAAMISDMASQLPDRAKPAAGGYQPTMLSAGPAVLPSPGLSPGLSAGPAAGLASGLGAAPATGLSAGPAVVPPTMPQPGAPADAGADTWGQGAGWQSRSSAAPEPDFSSWYSQARPAEPPAMPLPPAGSGSPPRAPATAAGPGGKRRPGLRWILALVALAIIGAGAGAATVMLIRHNDAGSSGATSTGSGANPGTGIATGTAVGVPAIVSAINSPSSGPFPSDFTSYSQTASITGTAAGFSLQYPRSWQLTRPADDSYQTVITNRAGNAYVLLDLTKHTYPGNMLAEGTYIRNAEIKNHPGYLQIGLARHAIEGAPGAFWQFTFVNQNGVRQEALDLLWVASTSAGQQSYAMYFTAPAGQWARLRPVFVDIARSFQTVPS
jgi:eukaryotic-like serine/threonine-protein kinase